jgi:hypothetical protein
LLDACPVVTAAFSLSFLSLLSEHNIYVYPIFPSITRALSIQKHSVNEKNDNARFAMKIEKFPNHLHTYAHNNLKQHISRK